MNTQQIDAAERFILDQLDQPRTFHQIITRTGMPRESLRTRLRVMAKRGAIDTVTDQGALRYVQKGRAAKAGTAARATMQQFSAAPGQAEGKPGTTERLRQVLATAQRPLAPSEIVAQMREHPKETVYTILNRLARRGEAIKHEPEPGERWPRYSMAVNETLAELRDHETYLREQAAGLLTSADRVRRIIEAMEASHA